MAEGLITLAALSAVPGAIGGAATSAAGAIGGIAAGIGSAATGIGAGLGSIAAAPLMGGLGIAEGLGIPGAAALGAGVATAAPAIGGAVGAGTAAAAGLGAIGTPLALAGQQTQLGGAGSRGQVGSALNTTMPQMVQGATGGGDNTIAPAGTMASTQSVAPTGIPAPANIVMPTTPKVNRIAQYSLGAAKVFASLDPDLARLFEAGESFFVGMKDANAIPQVEKLLTQMRAGKISTEEAGNSIMALKASPGVIKDWLDVHQAIETYSNIPRKRFNDVLDTGKKYWDAVKAEQTTPSDILKAQAEAKQAVSKAAPGIYDEVYKGNYGELPSKETSDWINANVKMLYQGKTGTNIFSFSPADINAALSGETTDQKSKALKDSIEVTFSILDQMKKGKLGNVNNQNINPNDLAAQTAGLPGSGQVAPPPDPYLVDLLYETAAKNKGNPKGIEAYNRLKQLGVIK